MSRDRDFYTTNREINIEPSKLDLFLKCEQSPEIEARQKERKTGIMMHAAARQLLETDNTKIKLPKKERQQVDQYVKYVRSEMAYWRGEVYLEYYLPAMCEGLKTGRCDALIVSKWAAKIIDLKTGAGGNKLLKANESQQLKSYALTVVELFGVETVYITIWKAETHSVSSAKYTKKELYEWRDSVILPAVQRAKSGQAECNPGDHCRHCKGKMICSGRFKILTDLLNAVEAAGEVPLMIKAMIAARATQLKNYIDECVEDVQPYIDAGYSFSGLEIIEGQSHRKLTDKGRQMLLNQIGNYQKMVSKDYSMDDIKREVGEEFLDYMDRNGGYETIKGKKQLRVKDAD